MPLWHCSVSIHRPLRPLAKWSEQDLATVRRAVEITLRGVGDPAWQVEQDGQVALHVRRRMVEAEARALYARRGVEL